MSLYWGTYTVKKAFYRFEMTLSVIPAKAGIQIDKSFNLWIPAFAGMTPNLNSHDDKNK